MAGLLDSGYLDLGNPGTIQGLLAQFQPSEADRAAAQRQALLTLGLGLMGATKGHELQALGQAGQRALLARQQYLDDLQAQKLHAMQLRGSALNVLNKEYQYNDASLLRQQQQEAARRFASGGFQSPLSSGVGGSMQSAPGDLVGVGTDSFAMNDPGVGQASSPPTGPSSMNSGLQAPGAVPMKPPLPDRRQMATRLNAIGDYWSSVGRMPQAEQYYKMAQAAMPQLKDQKVYTKNGQRIVVNVYNDGSMEVEPFSPDLEKLHFADSGGAIQGVDPFTAAPVGTPIPKSQTPDSVASVAATIRGQNLTDARARENIALRRQELDPFGLGVGAGQQTPFTNAVRNGVHGDEFLATLPSALAAQVKALAEGRQAFPTGYALRSPQMQTLIQMVSQYDPSFDAVNYAARSKTRNDFTAGKSAQQVNALNTVIGHLGQLSNAADALNNTSIPLLNQGLNFAQAQLGDPRIKQFDITRKAVVDELTRVYRGTGGSEKDIDTWTQAINSANSPEQLHGAIAQIGGLLESKIQAMEDQYRKGMGTTSQGLQLLTPHARDALDVMERRASGAPTTSAQPQLSPAARANPTAAAMVTRVLKSGDAAKIDELRRLGWLQ